MRVIQLSTLASLFLSATVLAQVPQKIVVEHFTNSNCGTCAIRNPGFYTNLANHPGVLHLAIHPSAPYPNCLLYQQNATDNNARTNYYGIFGSTPRIVVNGNVVSASANYGAASIFSPYLSLNSPASIYVSQITTQSAIQLVVTVKTEAAHSLGNLKLFVALAEDTVYHTGTNGETIHFDVFRKSVTSTTGDDLNLPVSIGDSLQFTYSIATNSAWNLNRIFALVIIQDAATKNTVQAEASSPSQQIINSTDIISGDNYEPNIYPNPASQQLNIEQLTPIYNKGCIYGITGNIIKCFDVSTTVNINVAELPKGIYLLQLQGNGRQYHQKFVVE